MDGVSIRVNDAAVRAAVGRVVDRMTNARGLYDGIGAAMVVSTQMRFERERAPDGNPWPQSLRARLEGGKTLQLSARLVQSITHIPDDDGVAWGSDVAYARIHQLGGTIKREARIQTIYRRYDARTDELSDRFVTKRMSNFATDHEVGAYEIDMPARPYLGIDDDDRAEIEAQVKEWLAIADGAP